MRKFGLIGFPLGHSFSKKYFTDKFEREGITDQKRYVDLYSLMHDFIGSDDPSAQLQMQDGSMMNYLPVKKLSLPVDVAAVRKNGTVRQMIPFL